MSYKVQMCGWFRLEMVFASRSNRCLSSGSAATCSGSTLSATSRARSELVGRPIRVLAPDAAPMGRSAAQGATTDATATRGEGRGVAAQTSRAVELESVPPSTAREGVVDETRRSVTPPVASILAACPPPVGRDSCAPLADPTTPDRSLSSWRTSASRRTRACSRCSPGCSRTPPSTTRSPTTYGATIDVLWGGGRGGVCTSSCSCSVSLLYPLLYPLLYRLRVQQAAPFSPPFSYCQPAFFP